MNSENKDHFKQFLVELIVISWNHEFRNKDHFNIKVFFARVAVWQAARILFWKTSIVFNPWKAFGT